MRRQKRAPKYTSFIVRQAPWNFIRGFKEARKGSKWSNTMIKSRSKMNRFALVAICCSLGVVLLPTDSFANLNRIVCSAIKRGCYGSCNNGDQSEACYNQCRLDFNACMAAGSTTKQQTPPPPCRGIHCSLRNPHPPTTVGQPTRTPRPVTPVNPVGLSNPNKTTNAPVILLRKNDSGGGQGRGHKQDRIGLRTAR